MSKEFSEAESLAILIVGKEAYDNSPCQAHPLEVIEHAVLEQMEHWGIETDESFVECMVRNIDGWKQRCLKAERALRDEQDSHTQTQVQLAAAEREQDALREAERKIVELRQALAEEMSDEVSRDAARYRWLRERLEVRKQEALNGTFRDGLSVRIGCTFLDSEVSTRRSLSDPDAHENRCKKFDAAIDAAMERQP